MRRYIIPSLKDSSQPDRLCPRCNTPTGRIHQRRRLPVTDTRPGAVTKLRRRCPLCASTWTVQPHGVKAHFQRSQRVRALNLLFYALGLSYEAAATAMTALGAAGSDPSVYRDLLESMQAVEELHRRGRRKARVAGIDGTGQRLAQPGNAHSEGLVSVVDCSDGQLLAVELLDGDDAAAVAALIKELEADFGLELWVTDEHKTYPQAIGSGRRQLCTAHFERNKLRRVRGLQGQARPEQMRRDLEELEGLLREPPQDGKQRAGHIYRRRRRVKRPRKGKRASPASQLK